jgi:hypothetical protein
METYLAIDPDDEYAGPKSPTYIYELFGERASND